jgi:hypothetical protein
LAGDSQDIFPVNDEESSGAILLRVNELIDKADNEVRKPK